MSWKQLWARKSLDRLLKEMEDDNRLHRALGPVALTSLGVGAIIGAGIFAMTGQVAAADAGPAIVISFVVAGIACAFAAFCYAEFAAMAPVAGSAYTYTYATLGELWAWIIGWDLVLEYAMSSAVVAAHWANYFNQFLKTLFGWQIPEVLLNDPFTLGKETGHSLAWGCNLPAMLIIALVTVVLVLGIRESAAMNTIMVLVKLGVVLFVIGVGWRFVNSANWTSVPVAQRLPTDTIDFLHVRPELKELVPDGAVHEMTTGAELLKAVPELARRLDERELVQLRKMPSEGEKWGLLGVLGFKHLLQPIDDRLRSPFCPYGLSGLMVGAALVFFSYIGFDSISTHSEEAKNPQRDVPIGILASLALCTVLYMAVAAVISGMEPYPDIDPEAAVATAFSRQAERTGSGYLRASAGLVATGALAGMTSVLLVTFLSQARIFLAMSRDGLLPPSIFAAIHSRFRTPHRSTILTGAVMCVVAGFTPIRILESMVNIGTLMAFVLVCASVLLLRVRRPDAHRPFRCPFVFLLAPAGILTNLVLMLFLPVNTWVRLALWLLLGIAMYLMYGRRNSVLGREMAKESS
ncbi:MAG: amino acid permease [Planctomycetes bacterium]|nr:amino acid permease [Planctomycetota bacterium]